jgi:hypothetical protein
MGLSEEELRLARGVRQPDGAAGVVRLGAAD